MKEKINSKRLWVLIGSAVLCTAIVIGALSLFGRTPSQIKAQNGRLDFADWQLQQQGPVGLSGQWVFYWSRFLTPEELAAGDAAPDLMATVPDVWNKYRIDGAPLPGFGYATYHLRVENVPQGTPLAIRIHSFSTAYALYIDDELLCSRGKLGVGQFVPECKAQVAQFTPKGQSFDITVHVANYTYFQGGMCYAIQLGTPEQILSMDKTIADRDLFLFGALTIMAFYYMGVFLLRREEKSNLYFVLMCVLLAGRTAINGDFLIYRLLPSIGFETVMAIDYITLCWFSVCAAYTIAELFPAAHSAKVLRVASVYAVMVTLLVLLTPVSFYSQWIYIIEAAGLLLGGYCVFLLILAYRREEKDALTMLLGVLAFVLCAADDIIFQTNASQAGSFLIVLVQPFILAKRHSEDFQSIRGLSQKLLRLDRIKDEFLANTSHELRTPLSGILGITEAMLGGSAGQMNDDQRQGLTTIAGSTRRLTNLVGDILDYSRMKSGDIRLDIRPIQLSGLIHTVVKVFIQLSQSKEFEIIHDIPENLPCVLADENRVVQILYNLVGNAVKFTVRGCVRISARNAGDLVEVCVSDTGEGIPQDSLEDIFKSFEQVDTSLTRGRGGTGLGLPITKQLVELLGGTIRVESLMGIGSRFYFTLPAADMSAVPWDARQPRENMVQEMIVASDEDARNQPEAVQMRAPVLLVDDDAVNLQAGASILRMNGYDVVTAGGGRAALAELAKRRDFSAVVLDVMMPELSGYEVCKKIRELRPGFDLPVLLLTANASTRDMIAGFEAGANDYLPKPYEPEELLARLGTLVNLKASVDRAMAAEAAFMQAQIKPHFLFNTLNAISSFCDSDPERAQSLIDSFANYLRQSFDFQSLDAEGPLERELSLVNSYVEIERARFGESLRVEFDIEDGLSLRLPLLSIQPLVENAIAHGLRKKGGGGTVTVAVRRIAQGVRICVQDDGQGIAPERLNNLLNPQTGQGVGLRNVDKRLKKAYGAGLAIQSTPGKGTSVSFLVPVGGDLS